MKKLRVRLIAGALLAAAGLILYLFLWGKLFPFTPLVVGFSRHELPNVVVYLQRGLAWNDYRKIEAWIPAVESFHELAFKKKPRIFFFGDKGSYLRRTTTKARFCAYPNGTLVVSPWALKEAEEGTISLEIYLRHELSHTLLYQHMVGAMNYVRFPRWLLEGIATYSAGQMGTSWYPSKEETLRLIAKGEFLNPWYFKTKWQDRVRLDVPCREAFLYSEFACIVDALIEYRGKDAFLTYMKRLLNLKGTRHYDVFLEIYGIDFNAFVKSFKVRAAAEKGTETAPPVSLDN